MSQPSKIIFLMTSSLMVLLAIQAEPITATLGFLTAGFYAFVSLVAWIQDSRSK